MPFDEITKLLAFINRFDLGWLQRAADDQPHAAAVTDQPLDAARRKRQGAGIEVSGQPVIALGILQCGNVEQCDEIAVIRGVFELPHMIAEHGQAFSSRHRLSCSGSSISSR